MTEKYQQENEEQEEHIDYNKVIIKDIIECVSIVIVLIGLVIAFIYYQYIKNEETKYYIENGFHQEIIDGEIVWIKDLDK